jgi:hypothetical protein
MPMSEKLKTFLAYSLGTLGVFVTLFFGGWAVCSTLTGERVKTLEEKVQERDNQVKALIAELARCQTEGGASKVARGIENGKEDGGTENGKETKREIKLTVLGGDTGTVGDQLTISVVGTRATYDPLSYVVTANFGAPGKETLGAPGLRIGERVSYNGYEIRLLAANLSTATFGIREIVAGK